MPFFKNGEVSIHFEEKGQGIPVLLISPSGLYSTIDAWKIPPNPVEDFADDFHLILMDQRNAGESSGPLDVDDPWGSFIDDQLGLMSYLGIERFVVLGRCIGCSYALKLAERAPDRVTAAVIMHPIGVNDDNRSFWFNMNEKWTDELRANGRDIDPETANAFGQAMWKDDLVVSVTRDFIRSCTTPLLVFPGANEVHPSWCAYEVAELAPNAQLVAKWQDTPEEIENARRVMRAFIREHAPA